MTPKPLALGVLLISAILVLITTSVTPGDQRKPFFIAWNYDTSGYIETCGCSPGQLGGIAKRATLLAGLRERLPTLAIEGAHLLATSEEFQLFKGKVIIRALNGMDYDAMMVGLQEAQLGQTGLEELCEVAEFPCFTANLEIDDQPWAVSSALVEIVDAKVGITGVSQPEAVIGELPPGVAFTDPAEALDEVLATLAGVDLAIVCLEGEAAWISRMESEFSGRADLFLTGDRVATASLEFSAEPPVLNNCRSGQYLGKVTANPKGAGYAFSGQNLPVSDSIADDRSVSLILDEFFRPELTNYRQVALASVKIDYIDPEECSQCHFEAFEIYRSSDHAHALASLRYDKQFNNPDCIHCHLVINANDTIKPINCQVCHTSITREHIENALAGVEELHEKDSPAYTYEWCVRCHDELNSLPFKDSWPEYVERIYHGGDRSTAQEAAETMGFAIVE